ncbi:MAG: restriction endonuclease subunit S [Desulfuromonas sp.]|nr:restriction endonuclease subunit S [Desulfuromonas sp.]
MERYEKYKASGVEWIGEIPEGWEVKKLKYLATERDDLFTDGDWIESKYIVFDDSQIRYITTGNIGEGYYKEQGFTYVTEETFRKLNCTEIFRDDLLISRLNPPIGRCCIIPDLGKRIVTSVDNVVLRPNERYLKKFLMYAMSNSRYFEFTSLIARGATMQRISRGLLGNVAIPIAKDFKEQTAIANYLDRKTAEIDKLIAQKERLLELYEEEKTAIINQAVTKGIDPDVKLKDSGIDWLGEIPEGWEVKKLKYVAHLKSGNNLTSSQIKDSGGFPVYGGNGLRGFYDKFTHEGEFVLIGRQGALCGNINYADGKFWATDHAVVLT